MELAQQRAHLDVHLKEVEARAVALERREIDAEAREQQLSDLQEKLEARKVGHALGACAPAWVGQIRSWQAQATVPPAENDRIHGVHTVLTES